MTLTELLVVVSVIGILLAIALPAVMKARSAARSISCVNNIKQICLGTQNYATTWKRFPPGSSLPEIRSAFVRILPQIEGQSFFESLLSGTDMVESDLRGRPEPPSLYRCPDSVVDYRNGETSTLTYLFIAGGGYPGYENGIVSGVDRSQPVRFASISDGLSQTGLLAECYPSAAQQSVSGLYDDPVGAVFRTSRRFDMSSELDAYLVECDQIGQIVAKTRPTAFKQFGLGADWTNGSLGVTRLICMNPTQLTNCSNGPSYRAGLFAPSSNHEGRFHIGLADGAVRSLTNQVDKEVWRALGSKDGSEVINHRVVLDAL